MSLILPADVKALVNTSMSDANLQIVIDRIESQITTRVGAPQTDGYETEITKTLRGEGSFLFMPTEIHSVTSISEDTAALTSDEYQTWGGGVIERLPSGSSWGDRIVVTYKPTDDRPKRKQAIIDLVRITLEWSAMQSENVAGEYSYQAPDNWEVEFRKVMKRLMFKAV